MNIYIIGVFAASFVLVLIVGFIGNKAVDGVSNRMRSKRVGNKRASTPVSRPESLGARYAAQNSKRGRDQ